MPQTVKIKPTVTQQTSVNTDLVTYAFSPVGEAVLTDTGIDQQTVLPVLPAPPAVLSGSVQVLGSGSNLGGSQNINGVLVPTITILTISGNNIEIESEYVQDILPDTIMARITNTVGVQDSVSFIEGQLLIQMKNYPQDLTYFVDNLGNLILQINTGDGNRYSIDPEDGELEYN